MSVRTLALATIIAGSCNVSAQPNTELTVPATALKPNDSGWISLFDGKSLEHFFGLDQSLKQFAVPNAVFDVKNSAIWASGTAPRHILHKQAFTYFHFRMRYRHVASLGNAGLLYHVRLDGGSFNGQFPRSIEAQGNSGGAGDCWTIGQVIVKTKIAAPYPNTGRQYSETGRLVDHGDGNGRQCKADSNAHTKKVGDWNRYEIKVWGSDSSYHTVNGHTGFKAWDLRFSQNGTQKLNYGFIAMQSEGREMEYRDLEIKLLPADPLYPKLYPTISLAPEKYGLGPSPPAVRTKNDLSGGMVLILRDDSKSVGVSRSPRIYLVNGATPNQ